MSGVLALLGKAVAALGGPTVAGGLVVAGLLVGVIGGVAVGVSDDGPTASPSGALPIYPCPDQGPPLLEVPPGQRMLVTGRTEDGTWVRVHTSLPGRTEGWTRAAWIHIDGEVTALEVATCAPELEVASGALPSATLSAVGNNSPSPSPTPLATPTPTARPTPRPTARPTPRPTPKPTPTPAPTPVDTTAPALGKPVASPTVFFMPPTPPTNCPPDVPTVTRISITAHDAESGIDVVVFYYRDAAGVQRSKTMFNTSGATYIARLDSTKDPVGPPAVSYTIVARNGAGLTRQISARVGLNGC